MEKILLQKWTLSGYYPFLQQFSKNEYKDLSFINPIKATVPGSVYGDLLVAGLIKDPFYATNSLDCEWVANRWWVYNTEFKASDFKHDTKKVLCFDGINNIASIVLNGETLIRIEGANNPFELDITDKIKDYNVLDVIIESETEEYCQFGRTSKISTQRARYGYKWDFCIRLVDVGIYGEVYIKEYEAVSIKDCSITDKITDGSASVDICFDAVACFDYFKGKVKVVISDKNGIVAEKTESVSVRGSKK